MAKVAKELMAFRLRPEAVKAVKWWAEEDKVSQADVVEAAVRMYDESRTGKLVHVGQLDLRGSQPVSVPFERGSEPADAPFHPLCKHCGDNFGAFNRNASLCSDCKKAHHVGDPRDCPVCTAGAAI